MDTKLVTREQLVSTIEKVGFSVPNPDTPYYVKEGNELQKQLFMALGVLFGVILLLVVAGEGLGLFDTLTELVPLWVGTLIVAAFGATIFLDVFRSGSAGKSPRIR